jgi:hypothetical protein
VAARLAPDHPCGKTRHHYHRWVNEPIAMLLPLNIYVGHPGDVARGREAVADAAAEVFGAQPNVEARAINVGPGGDAGAILIQIAGAIGVALTVVLGPAELVKKGREDLDEYRAWARLAKRFVDRLRHGRHTPKMLSANLATAVLLAGVVIAATGCGDRPAPPSVAVSTPSPAEIAESRRFRESFGLRSDDAWIYSVAIDPASQPGVEQSRCAAPAFRVAGADRADHGLH